VDQAESPLYFVDLELRRNHPELEIVPVVADVTDQPRIRRDLREHRPTTSTTRRPTSTSR
jgi:FlaA1/EpsC-like NDP-sugar epimerase